MPRFPASGRSRSRRGFVSRHAGGFTLVELVVVIVIVGVLAALAVPRFIALGYDARVASVKALIGSLQSTTINVHAACVLNPNCDYSNGSQILTVGGRSAWLNYGWLDAGDNLNNNQIDAWIIHDGFTASLVDYSMTKFSLDGAQDPTHCYVTYQQALNPPPQPTIVAVTSGC